MPDALLQPPTLFVDGEPCKFCRDISFKDPEELAKHEVLCRTVKNLDPSGKPIKEYRKKVLKTVGETSFTGGSKDDPYDMSAVLALFEGEGSEKNKVEENKKKKKTGALDAAEDKKTEGEKKKNQRTEEEKKKNQRTEEEKKAAKKEKKEKKKKKRKEEEEEMKNHKDDKGKGIMLVESDNEEEEMKNESDEQSENVELNKNKIKMFSDFAKTSVEDAHTFLLSHNFDLNEALLAYTNLVETQKNE